MIGKQQLLDIICTEAVEHNRPPDNTVERYAEISACGQYRYVLTRTWDERVPSVVWIMHNPSTADGSTDDPTIRRCMGFARRWGMGGIKVVNLSAMRSSNPRMVSSRDFGGSEADRWIRRVIALSSCTVVAAWGALRDTMDKRAEDITRMVLDAGGQLCCLGITKAGHPRHPLYVRGDAPLQIWPWAYWGATWPSRFSHLDLMIARERNCERAFTNEYCGIPFDGGDDDGRS